ncbi:hypothetical protein D3C84_1236970 [compost metagenome]
MVSAKKIMSSAGASADRDASILALPVTMCLTDRMVASQLCAGTTGSVANPSSSASPFQTNLTSLR